VSNRWPRPFPLEAMLERWEGISAVFVWLISQQYFSLGTNQSSAINQQYFSLKTNRHQPSATSQTNRLQGGGGETDGVVCILYIYIYMGAYHMQTRLLVQTMQTLIRALDLHPMARREVGSFLQKNARQPHRPFCERAPAHTTPRLLRPTPCV
jgi:hypothetical protein